MRILIVEDELVTRMPLQRQLQRVGECDVVVNGSEAIAAFELAHAEGRPYDVIFLDIMMPAMNGRDALKQLRARESEMGIEGLARVKAVMMTCLDDAENVVGSFFDSGCEGYLTKPFSKEKLIAELKKIGIPV